MKCKADKPISAAKTIASKLFMSNNSKSISFTIKNKTKEYHYLGNNINDKIKVKVTNHKFQMGGFPLLEWKVDLPDSDKTFDTYLLGFAVYRLFYVKAINIGQKNDNYWVEYYQSQRNLLNTIANYESLNQDDFRALYEQIEKLYEETKGMGLTPGAGTDESINKDKHIVSSFLTFFAEQQPMMRPSGPE
jgi:hypothetical protein